MPGFIVEIAAFTLEGALTAQKAGANRVEFCENPADGGTTPSFGALKTVRTLLNIPVFPIIRPRAGDFLYSEPEYEVMKQDVLLCKSLGFEGIVTGILLQDGAIDMVRTAGLVNLAYPMEVTFHRAFDRCKDPLTSLEQVIDAGCRRILTSGQFPTAVEGSGLIKILIEKAGKRIVIMPGSGVRSDNVLELAHFTGANEFHASARTAVSSNMTFNVPSMQESLTYMDVDYEEVVHLQQLLTAL
jgi:copper homeostasis protein